MIARQVNVPTLNPASWNELVETLSRRLPMRCVRTGSRWTHPWLISPEYVDGQWTFQIDPGFVNGIDPEVATLASFADQRTLDRIDEETGNRPTGGETVDAWLTERPRIRFGATRLIGKGAPAEEAEIAEDGSVTVKFEGVPEFFYQFGVTMENVVFTGNLDSGIQLVENDTARKDTPPVLRAVDVVLSVDRLTAQIDIYRGNSLLDGFETLYSIAYGQPAFRKERPTLVTDAKYIQRPDSYVLEDRADTGVDTLKIATIYLLSPKNTGSDEVPDGTWRAFVRHDVFWNVAHASASIPKILPFEPIRLRTGLFAGLADSIFGGLLAPLNDNLSLATALLRDNRISGRFWSL
jgi:hypothetical protein